MTAEILQLAGELKLIRTGLPLQELARRARLIEQLESQLGNVKTDVLKAGDAAKNATNEAKTATRTANRYQQEFNRAKEQIAKDFNRAKNDLDKATKPLQDAYKKVDDGVQRLTKGLDKFAAAAGIGFGIAGVVISFAALWSSERNQVAFDRSVNIFEIESAKQGSFNQLMQNRYKNLNEKVDTTNKKNEKTLDYISQDLKRARSIADEARKMANNITYEARVRIQRLNDVVAQASSNASKALQQNTVLKSNVLAIDTKVKTIDVKVVKASTEASTARAGVKLVDTKASQALATAQQLPAKIPALVAPAVNNAIAPVKVQVQQARTVADNANAANSSQNQRLATLEGRVTAIANRPATNAPTTNAPTTNAPTINQAQVNQALVNSGIFPRLTAVESTAAAALARSAAALNRPNLEPVGNSALALSSNNAAAINKLTQDVQQLKAPDLLEPRIKAVETKIQERERVDQQSNQKLDQLLQDRPKLDQLLTLGVAIPLIAPSVISGISSTLGPQIQALPGATATAVAAAPCNGKGCGGRTAQRVDGLADEMGALRQQVSGLPNTVGNVVNGANAGANLAQLNLLNTIDGKLGAVLPNGGIGGMLSRIVSSSAVDKALQVATFVGVVHNAFNLSADLGRSFFSLSSSAINASLRTMGVTTGEDTPIDVGAIISGQIEAEMKALLGVQTWTQVNQAIASANRIYQAGSNVISNVWSMADSTRNVLEYTAENTGRIGNALKKERLVAPNAYPDMPERVTARTGVQRKWDNILEGVESLQSGVSALDSTFQSVVSINDSIADYQRSTAEFKDSIEKSPIPQVAANLAVKTKREAAIAVSAASPTVADVPVDAAEEPDAIAV
jgi:hypothetical protein